MNAKFIQLMCLAALLMFSPVAYPKSSVWKITKGDKFFYLGGTVHFLSASDHPLPKEFEFAYQNSEKLIFETDIVKIKTPESQQKFLRAMLFDSKRTLMDELDPRTFNELKNFLAGRQISIENFLSFQPWAVGLTISVLEYRRMGMKTEYGVEEYFNMKVSLDKKQRGYLESVDEQLSFLLSMADVESNLMINHTLRDLKLLPSYLEFLKNSWRKGDIEAVTKHSSIVQMKSEFPSLYNTLIVNRNNRWMKHLLKLNDNDIIEFVLVGALHLNGEEGLLSQLENEGFGISQLQ